MYYSIIKIGLPGIKNSLVLMIKFSQNIKDFIDKVSIIL